jgi:hypothetical protein
MTVLILAIAISLAWGAVDWWTSTRVPLVDPMPDRPPAPAQETPAPVPVPVAAPSATPAPDEPAPGVTPGPPDVDLPEEGDDDRDDDEEEDTEPAPPEPSAPSTASVVVRIAGLLTDGSPTVYDGSRCWGCERGCTYRGMRVPGCGTADAVRAHAERRHRAEHGYAGDLDAADGDLGDWSDLAGTPSEFNPIAIARAVGESKRNAWFELCESCSSFVRGERNAGRNPWRVVPVAVVAADETCPF